MRIRRLVLATMVVGAVAGGFTPSLAATAKPPKQKVELIEFQVKPAAGQYIAKGKSNFVVKNAGTETHEFVIVRGSDPAALPTKADGSVDEKPIPKSDQVGELENIKKGKTKSKTFKLSTASYILFCNTVDTEEDGTVVSHFARGMSTVINAS
jgi:hypothetical protein